MDSQFLSNKYTKIYFSIIERAQQREYWQKYTEEHHIVPRCLSGTNDSSNLVRLTPREHYICHALLPKMVKRRDHIHKMYAAFNMMHVDAHGNRYTSRLYEYYKIKFYKLHSESQKGKKRSLESRKKQSESTRGKPWSDNARNVKRTKPTAKPVLVYKKSTNEFVGEWESVSLCAKELNLDHSAIWKICRGDWDTRAPNGKMYPMKSYKGYIFRYKSV